MYVVRGTIVADTIRKCNKSYVKKCHISCKQAVSGVPYYFLKTTATREPALSKFRRRSHLVILFSGWTNRAGRFSASNAQCAYDASSKISCSDFGGKRLVETPSNLTSRKEIEASYYSQILFLMSNTKSPKVAVCRRAREKGRPPY